MAFGFEYVHWIEENMKTNCSTFLFNKGTYIYIYMSEIVSSVSCSVMSDSL